MQQMPKCNGEMHPRRGAKREMSTCYAPFKGDGLQKPNVVGNGAQV